MPSTRSMANRIVRKIVFSFFLFFIVILLSEFHGQPKLRVWKVCFDTRLQSSRRSESRQLLRRVSDPAPVTDNEEGSRSLVTHGMFQKRACLISVFKRFGCPADNWSLRRR